MTEKRQSSNRSSSDADDAPEWTKEQFGRAEIAIGGKTVRPAKGTLTRAGPTGISSSSGARHVAALVRFTT